MNSDGTKGVMIPAPESESEYDSMPSSTPDSDTDSYALESVVSIPSLVSIPRVESIPLILRETHAVVRIDKILRVVDMLGMCHVPQKYISFFSFHRVLPLHK